MVSKSRAWGCCRRQSFWDCFRWLPCPVPQSAVVHSRDTNRPHCRVENKMPQRRSCPFLSSPFPLPSTASWPTPFEQSVLRSRSCAGGAIACSSCTFARYCTRTKPPLDLQLQELIVTLINVWSACVNGLIIYPLNLWPARWLDNRIGSGQWTCPICSRTRWWMPSGLPKFVRIRKAGRGFALINAGNCNKYSHMSLYSPRWKWTEP